MDNWVLKGPQMLIKEQSSVNIVSPTQVKVKVSHLLLTDFDTQLFTGSAEPVYPKTIGRAAVGIVTEVGENCYGIEKNQRVYFEPTRPCGQCLECRSGKPKNCTSVITAGKDFDGFLRDFVVCEYSDVAPLPSSVDDMKALCIEAVGIAENIYDKLNLSAGQRVAVVGADVMGNIIAQVLQYHKLIPIVIDDNQANLDRIKKCGIYYAFIADDDLKSNILNATSGHLCDAAVYSGASSLPLSLSTRLVGHDKTVVIASMAAINAPMDVHDILAKNLTAFGVSNAYDYTDAVINMIIHGAVNVDLFEKEILSEFDPAALLKERCSNSSSRKGKMTILKMIL